MVVVVVASGAVAVAVAVASEDDSWDVLLDDVPMRKFNLNGAIPFVSFVCLPHWERHWIDFQLSHGDVFLPRAKSSKLADSFRCRRVVIRLCVAFLLPAQSHTTHREGRLSFRIFVSGQYLPASQFLLFCFSSFPVILHSLHIQRRTYLSHTI